jgi:hypothetical protein
MAGMGRANSVSGPRTFANASDRPSRIPVITPARAAMAKPVMMRISD